MGRLELAGRMRISGHVRDLEGAPLPGIAVYIHSHFAPSRRTDPSGFYDLNWFPLPGDAQTTVMVVFRAPRPHDGDMNLRVPAPERKPAKRPDPGAVYMRHTFIPVATRHNEAMELNVTLTPADLLTFKGIVRDASGSPVPHAQVMLFAGSARSDEWLDAMHPERMTETWTSPGRSTCVPLARTVADTEGGFALCIVRESGDSVRIEHPGMSVDLNRFSLGVESLGGAHAVLADIHVNSQEMEKRVNINLR